MRYDEIRANLVKRRREVMARYHGALRRADEELASPEPEDAERAAEQWDARVLSELSHVDLREIVRLTEAIQRIDEGVYGLCSECGESIPTARLRVLPTTRICADCAFSHEAHPMQ